MVYAEAFLDERLPSFIQGTVDALQFYGGVPKYLVPANYKTAVKSIQKMN
jgi:transposase